MKIKITDVKTGEVVDFPDIVAIEERKTAYSCDLDDGTTMLLPKYIFNVEYIEEESESF